MTDTQLTRRGRGRPRLYRSPEAANAARTARRKASQVAHDDNSLPAAATPAGPLLLTIPQAAKLLQISERTIATLVAEGFLSDVKIRASRRIPFVEIMKLAKIGTETATAALFEQRETR